MEIENRGNEENREEKPNERSNNEEKPGRNG